MIKFMYEKLLILIIILLATYFVLERFYPEYRNLIWQKTEQIEEWWTYTDNIYGFELKYPSTWTQSIQGVNFVFQPESGNNTLSIQALEGEEKKKDFSKDCSNITFAGSSAYDCPTGSYLDKRAIFFYKDNNLFIIHDNVENDISKKIISSFKFIR